MEKITVSIDDLTGDTAFLVCEETECLLDDTSIVKRASHILPWHPVLRVLFIVIRAMFGEYGKMAAFTRTWPCYWQVDLSPVGGPIVPVEWASRQSAIDFEVGWLNDNLWPRL
jgi:hypothetical protein